MASENSSFDFLNEGPDTSDAQQPLIAQCPHCKGKMKAPAKLAGRKVRCPKCQQGFALPASVASPTTATPPARQSTTTAAAESFGLPALTSVTVQASGVHQGRMLMKSTTKVEATAHGLTFTARTLRIKVAAAIILGAIAVMILGVGLVFGILSMLGINEGGVLPLLLAFFSLILLIFIAGFLAGWFKFLGQLTPIELTPEMPLEVQSGPKVKLHYHIALKVGREKIFFLVPESHRRELREFIASTLNKTAPVFSQNSYDQPH